MKYYCVAEFDVTEQGWVPEYVREVTRLVESHGGRYLARTPKVDKLEGEGKAPQVFLIIEWPSREAALAFYESEEYAPYLKSRLGGSAGRLFLVAGEDVTRTASGVTSDPRGADVR